MNRFLPQVSTACLLCVLATSSHAGIFKKEQSTKPSANDPLAGNTSKQPDKELFDKAMVAMKKGKYDVARLDLQTLLNTYPESEYQMRAKLAVGDSWFREGGTAALTQAEAEYKDFITFFPNQPEAAEAQMRVADIYYMQMEKPDRDHVNADRAAEEYRTMIQQFPDSPLVPRAKQRLRDVQEVLADRQYEVGTFYASHENWAASIARLQTLTDNYPLYSHSDLALIGLGDAYAAEARLTQASNIEPKAKQALMKAYDDMAADAYSRVVTHYSMAPHVEDARERLIALNRPIPEPNQQELAESEAEEQSRVGVTLKDRALFLVKRGPSTVSAARVGEPTMSDPKQVIAPDVRNENVAMFTAALQGHPIPTSATNAPTTEASAATNGSTPAPAGDSGVLQLENVPAAEGGAAASGNSVQTTIVGTGQGAQAGTQDSGTAAPPRSDTAPGENAGGAAPNSGAAPAANPPAANPSAAAVPAGAVPPPVAPPNTNLPPIEKPAAMADQTNDVQHNGSAAQVQTGTDTGANAKGKKKAPKFDQDTESSSKHKKKKGLDKLNPF